MSVDARSDPSLITVQMASVDTWVPMTEQLRHWVLTALVRHGMANVELTLRIVDVREAAALNHRYRGKNEPTNVLSFPFDPPPGFKLPFIGDIVICAAVVTREAKQQLKSIESHWAHIVIHGALHLLGYDHESEPEAQRMESLEGVIMDELGFADPYETIS